MQRHIPGWNPPYILIHKWSRRLAYTVFMTYALAQLLYTRFVQIVSGLELQWLFTGWDVFATSLGMFVHVLATHDTSCKWLRLLSWL